MFLCFLGIKADFTINKAINQDSPLSVINVDNFEEDYNLRRCSSQITVIDPYHHSAQQCRQQPQQQSQQQQQQIPEQQQFTQNNISSRKSSLGDSYPRNDSFEQYQSFEDQYSPYTQRTRNSEPQVPPSRRVSIRQSPASPLPRDVILEPQEVVKVLEELQDEKPTIYIEEETIKEPKQRITPHQRWLWAYNKIIMQLDVSTFLLTILCESFQQLLFIFVCTLFSFNLWTSERQFEKFPRSYT